MEMISIGLLGLGTVGSGVVKIIEDHQDKLMHQIGCPVKVKKILVQNKSKNRLLDTYNLNLTTDPDEIINDPEIDVIIEVMGGIDQTRHYLLEALKRKKHIVTANKDLMAAYGPELSAVASENGCDLFYEASVAGGIPILRGLVDGLASDKITKLMGIVNGTTNYILTKMSQNGRSYEEALNEAQALGFAEADPYSDVEGLDAARKMAILASLGFSMDIGLDDVKITGISTIKKEDLEYSKQFGYTMKLIGLANIKDELVEVSVQPTLLPNSHPLSSVHNEYNAVYVYGEAIGETMFYGPGAGSLPTATAVVSDLVNVLKNMRLGVNGRNAITPQFNKKLKNSQEIYSKYFMRIQVKDEIGVLNSITSIFAEHGVSFEKILQRPNKLTQQAEIVIVTHHASLHDYQEIMNKLNKLEGVKELSSSYRVEGCAV